MSKRQKNWKVETFNFGAVLTAGFIWDFFGFWGLAFVISPKNCCRVNSLPGSQLSAFNPQLFLPWPA
jgi:hypothetical protein